jgi:glycosyltransferase involved in cell wall biosynthesis
MFGTGGAERMMLTLAGGLDPARYQSTILYLFGENHHHGRTPDGVRVVAAGDPDTPPGAYSTFFRAGLRHARDADIVIGGQEGLPYAIALLAARARRKPGVAWVHTNWDERFVSPGASRVTRVACSAARYLHAIVACSRGTAEIASKHLRAGASRVRVIHNGLDIDAIRARAAAEAPEDVRPLLASPCVVSVGRLSREKDFPTLVRAHRAALDLGVPHRLLIVGDGDQRPAIEAAVREAGVEGTVTLAGWRDNPFPIVARSSCYAMSSIFEGFPLSPIEALILGTPVVATDCVAGPSEILDAGRYGRLAPPRDPRALGEAIAATLRDPDTPASRAQRRARGEEFGLPRFLHAWDELLTSLRR